MRCTDDEHEVRLARAIQRRFEQPNGNDGGARRIDRAADGRLQVVRDG